MGKRSATENLINEVRSQHIALSVAASLARTQLIPDPGKVYDSQHLGETLNVVARALAKVAQLYVTNGGEAHALAPQELEGVEIRRAATIVVLRDGRTLSSVSMKRTDLRQAVAILKTVGLPELRLSSPPAAPAELTPAPERVDPLASLVEIERLLSLPLVAPQVKRANTLAVMLARSAPQGNIANLAMQLVSVVYEAQSEQTQDADRLKLALARLRDALQEHPESTGSTSFPA